MSKDIKHNRRIIIATEKLPRTKYGYQARLVFIEHTMKDGILEFKEYSSHDEYYLDDRDDNSPYMKDGHYCEDLEEALKEFLERKNNSCYYKKLRLIAE